VTDVNAIWRHEKLLPARIRIEAVPIHIWIGHVVKPCVHISEPCPPYVSLTGVKSLCTHWPSSSHGCCNECCQHLFASAQIRHWLSRCQHADHIHQSCAPFDVPWTATFSPSLNPTGLSHSRVFSVHEVREAVQQSGVMKVPLGTQLVQAV
jgi:hypothetical protein